MVVLNFFYDLLPLAMCRASDEWSSWADLCLKWLCVCVSRSEVLVRRSLFCELREQVGSNSRQTEATWASFRSNFNRMKQTRADYKLAQWSRLIGWWLIIYCELDDEVPPPIENCVCLYGLAIEGLVPVVCKSDTHTRTHSHRVTRKFNSG